MEVLLMAVAMLAAQAPESAAEAGSQDVRQVTVDETFDGCPFCYRMRPLAEKPGVQVYRITYPSPVVTPVEQNNTVPADYYLPEGIDPDAPPRPAVICMHILDGDFELVRIICSSLARRGIPAIMFKLPYYGERAIPGGPEAMARQPELFALAIDQALMDVRRTVDFLASRPEVNGERVGITGISLGGIVAGAAAGADVRIHRAALMLAGGDLMTIINHARETRTLKEMIARLPGDQRAEIEQSIGRVDPLHFAPELRKRAQRGQVIMINAAEDEVIPPDCTKKLAQALGMSDQVTWFPGLGHYTAMAELPRALAMTGEFFAKDLPPDVEPPEVKETPRMPPLYLAAALVADATTLLTVKPAEGRCHLIDVQASVTPRGEKDIEGRIRLVHGAGNRFRLECQVAGKLDAAMGQGQFPWMAGGGKQAFVGSKLPDFQPGNPLQFARNEDLVKLRMAAGAAAGVVMAPDLLNRWVTAVDEPADDGQRTIRLRSKQDTADTVAIVFAEDGRTPQRATFDIDGTRGTVEFRAFRRDAVAHAALFEPPPQLAVEQVDPIDLYRTFSAMFNFAMEKLP